MATLTIRTRNKRLLDGLVGFGLALLVIAVLFTLGSCSASQAGGHPIECTVPDGYVLVPVTESERVDQVLEGLHEQIRECRRTSDRWQLRGVCS